MSSRRQAWLTAYWLLIHVASITLTAHAMSHNNEGDFAFDSNDDLQPEVVSHKASGACLVRRLWGVPDMPAFVGRAFKLQIPKEAFSGKIEVFKASGLNGPLPKWLVFDKHKGLLKGIPDSKDRGDHRLMITAMPHTNQTVTCPPATDTFTIEVKDKKDIPSHGTDVTEQCHSGEEEMELKIIIDKPIDVLSTKQKLLAVNNLASFMAVDYRALVIQSHEPALTEHGKRVEVLYSGLGDRKKKNSKSTTEIQLGVGCSGKLWQKHSILVHQIKNQAKDGTVSNLIHLPVISWQVVSYKHIPLNRKERNIDEDSGSGYNYDEEDYEGSAEDNYDEEDMEVEPFGPFPPPRPEPPTTIQPPDIHHPHRHHHGESTLLHFAKKPKGRLTTEFESEQIDMVTTASTTSTTEAIIEEDNLLTVTQTVPTSVIGDTTPLQPFLDNLPSSVQPTVVETITLDETVKTEPTEYVPRHDSETSPTTQTPTPDTVTLTAATVTSPSVEVSTYETPVVTPVVVSPSATSATSPQTEDTTTTLIAVSTVNANVAQIPNTNFTLNENISPETPVDEALDKKSNLNNSIVEPIEIVTTTTIFDKHKNRHRTFENDSILDFVTYPTFDEKHSSYEPEREFVDIYSSEPAVVLNETVSQSTTEITPVEFTSTDRSSTVIGKTTETVDITLPMNQPPQIRHRMKKMSIFAGKVLSYIIPEDIFVDTEDGTNLKLDMYNIEHTMLNASSWVQFNPAQREVYGLPLEHHVSKWDYIVEATDSQGATVHDTLDIVVQQHKSRRTVNHEVTLKFRLNKKYPATVDWQIRVLKGLVNLFRDTDMDQITVRNVTFSDPIEFVWTNDTLPKQDCPKADIDRLMGILQASPEGEPSQALISAMGPELIMKSVTWQGFGSCQGPPSTSLTPQLPNHSENFSPMPRNQIDIIKATVGELLVFKVPEDTFYDHEDGTARQLKMRLTKGDRSDIHPYNWLQFDSKNQEFYGLPLDRDRGRKEYQLICEDRAGLTASDALIVEVKPGHSVNPNMEFRMTIDTPYDKFVQSALLKRKFVENLLNLFDDKNPSSIRIKTITDRPTVVSWYNVSLPTNKCPDEEIKQLKNVLISNKSLTDKVHIIMGTEFPVVSVSFVPLGTCSMGMMAPPPLLPPQEVPPIIPSDDTSKSMKSDDYIVTFIVPIVVIVCMILIASLIACILYRRRRSGKMSVGDDEERQAFRSKGIPVIFQDELDEKPEATNKTPVIMKEEKPPLLPPPEYKGGDGSSPTPSHTPYHPPPPFTASRDNVRNNRPKPTPAYRKPPPYVPP